MPQGPQQIGDRQNVTLFKTSSRSRIPLHGQAARAPVKKPVAKKPVAKKPAAKKPAAKTPVKKAPVKPKPKARKVSPAPKSTFMVRWEPQRHK